MLLQEIFQYADYFSGFLDLGIVTGVIDNGYVRIGDARAMSFRYSVGIENHHVRQI